MSTYDHGGVFSKERNETIAEVIHTILAREKNDAHLRARLAHLARILERESGHISRGSILSLVYGADAQPPR